MTFNEQQEQLLLQMRSISVLLWGFVGMLENITIVYIIAFAAKYVIRSSETPLQPHPQRE